MTIAEDRAARLSELPFITAGAPTKEPLSGFFRSVRELWGQHELLGLLVRRELKAKYKDSSLGFAWTLIRPLIMLLIYYFVVGKVLGAQRSIPSYAIFVFSGLTLWTLFTEILTGGTNSIIANAGLIKKVYLPREIFPVAAVGSAFVNFGAQLVVLFAATIVLWQFPLHWALLLYGLPAILVVTVWATALGLLLSAVNVYLRDIQYLVEVGLLVLFWVAPIVYSYAFVNAALISVPAAHIIAQIYLANPMGVATLAFQKAIWLAGADPSAHTLYPGHMLIRLLVEFLVGVVALIAAQRVFARLQGNFAQEI